MIMKSQYILSVAAVSALGLANPANAARASTADGCAPSPPATCYPGDDCCSTYCLGPDNYGVNAPVRP